jgi:lipopolysaccharide transport system ATP-binding protein
MKARLGFSVSINIDPDILIVDEALAVGDAAFQRKCYAKMEEIRNNGATILFVSHSASTIVNLCTKAIWIDKGEKLLEGDTKLVTGLYMKNINKKNLDVIKIRTEYEQLLLNSQKPKKIKQETPDKLTNEYLNRSLETKSLISYDEDGAKIYNFYIENDQGGKVNTLLQGERYYYCYNIKYKRDFSKIRLGMYFKTKNGVALGGGQFPYLNTKEGISVQKNKEYIMRWAFECNFGEGEYFCNAGTFDIETQTQLHRVVDAYMFKVIAKEKSLSAGNVSFIKEGVFNEI